MKVCPSCAAEFDDQLNFCRQDGTALKVKPTGNACPSCGGEVGSGQRFCRHCGAGINAPKPLTAGEISQTLVLAPSETKEPEIAAASVSASDLAGDQLRQGKYQEAISTLDAIIKSNPEKQEPRLLHLYATVKLYNVYGYEKQIEDLRSLSVLSEKEREIVREIFLLRADEAQKRGKTDEAREYQRLATRVILGQPLMETAPERPELPPQPKPPEASGPRISRQVESQPQSSSRPASQRVDASPYYVRNNTTRVRKKSSRLVVSFVIVFGLAAILAAGMVVHYAKKRGVTVTDIFSSKSPATQPPEAKTTPLEVSALGQVLAAEELGFKVWGAGAADPNRSETVVSAQISSQLSTLRQLYQQEVQNKPELMGSLLLQLTINPAGTVTKVDEFAARIRGEEFKKAVINEVYKWRFPEAGAGLTKVNYPLLFVPPKMDVATVLQWERSAGPEKPAPPETKEETQVASQMTQPEPAATPGASAPSGQKNSPPAMPAVTGGNKSGEPGRRNRSDTGRASKVAPLPAEPAEKAVIGQYEIIYPTSVYREPRDDAPMIARIEAGTKVNVVDSRGEWLEIRSRQGRPPGFVKKDAATPLANR